MLKLRIQLKLLRMNTHRNDVWRTDGRTYDKHFQMPGHNFNAYAKFTITEEVYKKSLSKLNIWSLLEQREDFWILKLQVLSQQGLNILLNYPQDTILNLVSTHLFVHFILYRNLSRG